MATYRLFFIGEDDHIVKAEVVYCPTDDDAIAAARAACREHPAVEVWELARKVERVDADIVANYRGVVEQGTRTDTEFRNPLSVSPKKWSGLTSTQRPGPILLPEPFRMTS